MLICVVSLQKGRAQTGNITALKAQYYQSARVPLPFPHSILRPTFRALQAAKTCRAKLWFRSDVALVTLSTTHSQLRLIKHPISLLDVGDLQAPFDAGRSLVAF